MTTFELAAQVTTQIQQLEAAHSNAGTDYRQDAQWVELKRQRSAIYKSELVPFGEIDNNPSALPLDERMQAVDALVAAEEGVRHWD